VVERLNEDGVWRTAAQSVMNIDHKTSTPTPDLMKAYMQEGGSIAQLVKPGDLEGIPFLTADNIEPAKNEEGSRVKYLRDVYRLFMSEYLAIYAEKLRISRTKVVIGSNCTPAELGLTQETNTYIPTAPAGYSDNFQGKCFVIETGLSEIEPRLQSMTPLTTRDSLSVGVLEGKAFIDNERLIEGVHKLQNNIMGMEIANRHFDRPNLSFIYRDSAGTPRGYILAYEGVKDGQSFVYIGDLATDRENKMAGGRLIRQFFDAYSRNYGTNERGMLPLFTNARDTTSYPILLRHAERLANEKGLKARLVELGTYNIGCDLMHDVVILVGKDDEELDLQETGIKRAFEIKNDNEEEGFQDEYYVYNSGSAEGDSRLEGDLP
jgi:hypothetical protein